MALTSSDKAEIAELISNSKSNEKQPISWWIQMILTVLAATLGAAMISGLATVLRTPQTEENLKRLTDSVTELSRRVDADNRTLTSNTQASGLRIDAIIATLNDRQRLIERLEQESREVGRSTNEINVSLSALRSEITLTARETDGRLRAERSQTEQGIAAVQRDVERVSQRGVETTNNLANSIRSLSDQQIVPLRNQLNELWQIMASRRLPTQTIDPNPIVPSPSSDTAIRPDARPLIMEVEPAIESRHVNAE